MGRAAVHLFFPFPRLPSKHVRIQTLYLPARSGPSVLWGKEVSGASRFSAERGRGSADGPREREAAVWGAGLCAAQNSAGKRPWGSGVDGQDLMQ